MASTSKETRVNLAIQALKSNQKLSLRASAKLYSVPYTTLQNRRARRPSLRDIPPNSRKLTDLEEQTLVDRIIDLGTREFPPRLSGVEDMANELLRICDAPPVGKLWAYNFVKRQPALCTRYTRKYDYQRAKCEDFTLIQEWFNLV